jgi:hypothetical protein
MKVMSGLLLSLLPIGQLLAAPQEVDIVKKFTRSNTLINNIEVINKKRLNNYRMKDMPWTSTYLPAIRGYAADPFATNGSSKISFTSNLKKYDKSVEKFNKGKLELDRETIANLSTSDKYDLLVGNFKSPTSLSRRLFDMGDFLHDKFGKLTFWTGMCHGWSPAAISHSAPRRTVKAISVDGLYEIPFYPNDIKALLSTAFANNTKAFVDDLRVQTSGNPEMWSDDKIMPIHGHACRKRKPRVGRDGRANRLENERENNCEDLNPAFWHLAVINLMGIKDQALVVDIDHNEKVNNHPTAAYKIKYFNPATGESKARFRDNLVQTNLFPDDIRKEYRSENATYIIGVEMSVDFVDYQFFDKKNAKSINIQKYKERTFLYDLELDENMNIIGGEWRAKKENEVRRGLFRVKPGEKPDFIWYAPRGMKPVAFKESLASGKWNKNAPLPYSWADAATKASYETNLDYTEDPDEQGRYPYRPQPEVLYSIVNELLERSR